MNLEKKLRRWSRAGLLDDEAAQRILDFEDFEDFERHQNPSILLRAAVWLGSVTIGIGLISVVAANWSAIGDGAKLGGDALLLLGLAGAVYATGASSRSLAGEGLIVVYYVWTLASLALLGQIYQTGTPTWVALVFWSVATLPLMLLARSVFTGWLWFVGLSVTYLAAITDLIESSRQETDMAASLVFLWLSILLGISVIPWFRERRSEVASALRSGAWAVIFVAGAWFPFLFYTDIGGSEQLSWSIAVTGVMTLGVGLGLPWLFPDASGPARMGVFAALVLTWAVMSAGLGLEHEPMRLVGLLLQIAYLAVLAWTSLQFERVRWFNLLTGLIALRVLIAYFEVFGSMLSTGVGMVVGGLLTLLTAWLWTKKSPQLAARLTAPGGSHVA